jgi:glycine betaine/choline ABC-type transport system substrate-binding protein
MDIQQRPDNAQPQHNNYQRQCKSTPPITLTISTTIALTSTHVHTFNNHNSNKSHQHGSTYINIDYKISQQFHILLMNQVKWNNTTFHGNIIFNLQKSSTYPQLII